MIISVKFNRFLFRWKKLEKDEMKKATKTKKEHEPAATSIQMKWNALAVAAAEVAVEWSLFLLIQLYKQKTSEKSTCSWMTAHANKTTHTHHSTKNLRHCWRFSGLLFWFWLNFKMLSREWTSKWVNARAKAYALRIHSQAALNSNPIQQNLIYKSQCAVHIYMLIV